MSKYRIITDGKYIFENGYGASVVSRWGTYGFEEGRMGLAVLRLRDDPVKYELAYDTDITDGVIGRLGSKDIEFILDAISRLGVNGHLPEGDPYFDWGPSGE